MRVSRSAATPNTYRYGIVNCRFFGTDTFTVFGAAGNATAQRWRLALDLVSTEGAVRVHLEPLPDYSHLVQTDGRQTSVLASCDDQQPRVRVAEV